MATKGKAKPLTGAARERMIDFIHKPLSVWLRTIMKSNFDAPKSAEACDITTEAVARAVRDTIGASPMGKGAVRTMAFTLLDSDDGKETK